MSDFAKDTNVPINDLISRQAAIDALNTEIVKRRMDEEINDDGTLDEFDTVSILRKLPTADVVEVVRCKDCIYNFGGNCDAIRETLEGDLIGVTLRCSDDFYCAYGERRKDEKA